MRTRSLENKPADSILRRTSQGQRAALWSQVVRVLCKIAAVPLLARLVQPAEHGLYAMGASLTLLLSIFRDLGLGVAAIRASELTEDQRTTLWFIHVALGTGLMLATVALAPVAAWFYGEPRVIPLLVVMSVSFVFMGLSAWPRVLLARDLEFTVINQLETVAVVAATVAMVVAGAIGWGAYSFAVFLLVLEAIVAVASWRACKWRPQGHAGWRHLGGLLPTGLDVTGYNFLVQLSQQLDSLLLGKWFGPQTLGLYFRSSQLLQMPALHITTPLAQITLASLSRLGRSAPEFVPRLKSTVTLALHLALPLSVFCAVLPQDVAVVVLGRDWVAAAPFLRWIAISAAVAAMTALGYSLDVAADRTRRLTGLALLALAANIVALTVARPFGAVNIALALAASNVVLLLPRLWWITHDTPVRLADFAAASLGPLGTAFALAAGLSAAGHATGWPAGAPRLAVGALGGFAAVGLLCAFWSRPRRELGEIWAHRPRGMAAAPARETP